MSYRNSIIGDPEVRARLKLFQQRGEEGDEIESYLQWLADETEHLATSIANETPAIADSALMTAAFDALLEFRQKVYNAVLLGVDRQRSAIAAVNAETLAAEAVVPEVVRALTEEKQLHLLPPDFKVSSNGAELPIHVQLAEKLVEEAQKDKVTSLVENPAPEAAASTTQKEKRSFTPGGALL